MNRAVLIACGLGLLGLILWLALGTTTEGEVPDGIDAPVVELEPSAEIPVLPGDPAGSEPDPATAGGLRPAGEERAPEARRAELKPERAPRLRVQLLDFAGNPVPGEMIQLIENREWTSVLCRAGTDATTGIAEFRNLERLDRDDGSCVISVEAVLAERIEVPFDPAAPPAEVVKITLPPTGFAEVRVLAERGTELDGPGEVTLGTVAKGETRAPSPFEESPRSTLTRTLEGGLARFTLVEAGTDLEVAARRKDARVATRVLGPGPARAGEGVTFEVQLGADHPVIVFRALGPDGHPLPETDLEGLCGAETNVSGMWFALSTRTDRSGLALIDMEAPWSDGTSRVLDLVVGSAGPSVSAELDLSYALEPGINDLGDVVFEPDRSLFATGRIVDSSGAPVPQAWIHLLGWSAAEERWLRIHEAESEVAADGTFEVRAVPPVERTRIGARHPGFVNVPIDCARGDRNLEIVLDAEGVIAGDVLIEPEIPERTIKAWIGEYTVESESTELQRRSATVDVENAFRLGGLFPGTYEIVVGIDRRSGGLVSVPGVVVLAGETTRDPRLSGIDLRGMLHVHQLQVDGDGSVEVPGFGYRFRPAGGDEWGPTAAGRNGEASIVTPHERIDFEVFAAGCRAVRQGDVAGVIEVTLQAGLPVRLLLRGGGAVPGPPLRLKPRLVVRGVGPAGGVDLGGPGFDERREVDVIAPGPGEMEVVWVVETTLETMQMSTYADPGRKWYVEVLDVEGLQTFELEVSADEMAKILGHQ